MQRSLRRGAAPACLGRRADRLARRAAGLGSASDEARHDAPRARRGRHRRRADRVPPRRRHRLRGRDRQPLGGRDDRDPRALRARGTSAPHSRARRRSPPERVGHAHGPLRRDRVRRGLDPERRRGRVLVAAGRRLPRALRGGSGAVRRRARRLAQLRAASRRRPLLRRADDGPALHAVLPSAPAEHPLQVRAPRRAGRSRSAAGTTRRSGPASSRSAAGIRSRSSTSRSARSRTACASTSRSSSRSSGTPRRASRATWRMRTAPTARAGSRTSTRRSSSTTRELERRVELGELAIDTRLRDRLAALGLRRRSGDAAAPARRGEPRRRPPPRRASTRRSRSRTSASPTARRIDALERRLSALARAR